MLPTSARPTSPGGGRRPGSRSCAPTTAASSAARNLALAAATGEIVAYLDVDNAWHPTYLARVVDALARRADAGWTVAAQLVVRPGAVPAVRDDRLGAAALARQNFIDLNALAHRRALLDVVGGFDEERARLGDWDLVLRLMAVAGEPVRLPAIGSIYNDSPEPRRISRSTPLHPHLALIRDRGRGHPAKGLRVLLAEWHYPQASESYVRSDLIGLQALGAHVEVWSESDVAVPYQPDAPLHRGDLADAIARSVPTSCSPTGCTSARSSGPRSGPRGCRWPCAATGSTTTPPCCATCSTIPA